MEVLGVLASEDWASASLELEGLESGSPESESRVESESRLESGSLESGPKALGSASLESGQVLERRA